MHAGHQGGCRLTLSVQTAITLKAGLQFPDFIMVFGFCKVSCVPAMAVSNLCMLFHEPGVMLAADMQAMQDEAVRA